MSIFGWKTFRAGEIWMNRVYFWNTLTRLRTLISLNRTWYYGLLKTSRTREVHNSFSVLASFCLKKKKTPNKFRVTQSEFSWQRRIVQTPPFSFARGAGECRENKNQ